MDATDAAQVDNYGAYGLRRELAVIKGNVPRVEAGARTLGPATILGGLALAAIGAYAYSMWKEREPK